MSDPAGDRDGDAASDWPAEPEEGPLPGEDNPGERLIETYDPTVEGDDGDGERGTAEERGDRDVPAHVARLFWTLVGVFNVALIALALGVMLIGFRGRWALGGQLVLAGTILFVYGYYRYRNYRDDGD